MAQANTKKTKLDASQLLFQLKSKPIVLIGMMGAGKTSLGRRLALKLGRKFIDSDVEIEQAAGMNISDFFKTHGENDFRKGEAKVIARILSKENTIIGTGGGAFMNDKTRALLKSKALTIWIDADFEVLFERISRRPTRPLMQTDNPRQTLKNLIEQRYPTYEKADIKITSADVPHEVVIEQILTALKNHLDNKS